MCAVFGVWCLMCDDWRFFLCFCFYVWLPCLMSEIRYLMCDLCKLMFCRCLIWILDEWDSMFDFRDAMFDAFYMLSASSADVARFLALLLFFLGYPAMVGVLSCSWKSWSWTLSPIRLFRSVTRFAEFGFDISRALKVCCHLIMLVDIAVVILPVCSMHTAVVYHHRTHQSFICLLYTSDAADE